MSLVLQDLTSGSQVTYILRKPVMIFVPVGP